jgi:hypothetical protein
MSTFDSSRPMSYRDMSIEKKLFFTPRARIDNPPDSLSLFTKNLKSSFDTKLNVISNIDLLGNIDLKNITKQGFDFFKKEKVKKEKQVFPDQKFCLNLKRGEKDYFYCRVEEENFPVTLTFLDKRVV